jgi:hypothetical protein
MGKGKRSVDKEIKNYANTVTNTSDIADLFPGGGSGVTFPCTISGVRVMGTVYNATSATPVDHFWAVAIQRQGETLPNAVFTSLSSTLTPEEDVMVWGRGTTTFNTTNNYAYDVAGTTKRKLMIGDKLRFLAAGGTAAVAANFQMVIQFFVLI